jgi:aspartate aminotransferase-like enzyme
MVWPNRGWGKSTAFLETIFRVWYASMTEPLLLMTPGPTRVPESVLSAGAMPMLHPRSGEFSVVLASVLERLRRLFGAAGTVLPVHSSGRGAMEATIVNLLREGDTIVACCNGRFGEMWAEHAERHGIVVHRVACDWSRDIDLDDVEQALVSHPEAKALTFAHCDTATGVANDAEALCRLAHSRGVLAIVDAISTIGGAEFRFDEWSADVAVTASQACLMSSPGMAFVALSERARRLSAKNGCRVSYWDFTSIERFLGSGAPDTPAATPVHIVCQLDAALRCIESEGLQTVFVRHEVMSAMVRERLPAMGLELAFPLLQELSPTLTAIRCPAGSRSSGILRGLHARGILVAPGVEPHDAEYFRIGHLGDIRSKDVARTLDALEEVLAASVA